MSTNEMRNRYKLENTTAALANARGMTIVEIMIVLTILASLMGAIAFGAFNMLDKANEKEAKIRVGKMTENVRMYQMTASPRALPSSLSDLTTGANKVIDKIEKDPWGNDLIYTKKSHRDFEVRSAGADGVPNTADDICAEGPCDGE